MRADSTLPCYEFGVDYPYNDIEEIPDVTDPADCQALCFDNEACKQWVLRMDQSLCYLKSVADNVGPLASAVTGSAVGCGVL